MTLKDQIAADLPTFLDAGEFGEVRDVSGSPILCVLDDDQRNPDPETGIFLSESVLHLRGADLAAVPVITQRMTVNGRLGTVVHVDDAMGMLSIRLRWFES